LSLFYRFNNLRKGLVRRGEGGEAVHTVWMLAIATTKKGGEKRRSLRAVTPELRRCGRGTPIKSYHTGGGGAQRHGRL
jgi:hypothetical protein